MQGARRYIKTYKYTYINTPHERKKSVVWVCLLFFVYILYKKQVQYSDNRGFKIKPTFYFAILYCLVYKIIKK